MTTTTISVADLLRGISNKDSAAWDELIRRYGKFVAARVRSFKLQEADALDAIQMTWLRLAENPDRVHFPDRLGGWLATTARCECLHILRQAKRIPTLADIAPELSRTLLRIPSSVPSTLMLRRRCASSSTSYHRTGEP
ncbi:MAG: RNA polymerase sigma factor [Pseudonocardiaceae bacterium]